MNDNFARINKQLEMIFLDCKKYYNLLAKKKNIGRNNLILFYFHELMYFFCTSLLQKKIRSKKFAEKKIIFLHRDGKSILEKQENKTFNRIKNLLNILSSQLLPSKKKIYLYKLNINKFELVRFLVKAVFKGYSINFITQPKHYFENIQLQSRFIKVLTLLVKKKYKLNFDFEEFKFQLDRSIKSLGIDNKENIYKREKKKTFFITSNVASIYSRLFALAGYNKKNSKTIVFFHSDEMGSVSQFAWRYDDLSTSDILIGYGKLGKYKNNKDKNLKSLNKLPRIYVSNSERCFKFSKSPENKNPNLLINNSKGCYISEKIKKINAIQPDHFIINPEAYIKWQDYFFPNFKNLTFKLHPKQNLKINYKHIKKNCITNEPIDEIFEKFDYFVFDYVSSSAFQILAATKKPIIYYDIGISKLSSLGNKYLNTRVKTFKVNIYKSYKGFKIPSKLNNNNFNFISYSKNFSLPFKKETTRTDILIDKILF